MNTNSQIIFKQCKKSTNLNNNAILSILYPFAGGIGAVVQQNNHI